MRCSIRSATMFLGAVVLSCASTFAQTSESPGAFPWEGEVTGANVFVRSGAGNNWYPTAKLNAGDRVLVLGEKFGWYQIDPPAGSFSYIDMNMVDRKAGAKTGTVKQDKVYVRAGSKIEKRKSSTQLVLNKGATVEITGEDDGFFQIKPPAGASLFISKQYVKPVGAASRTGLVEKHVSNKSSAQGTPPEQTQPEKPAEPVPQPITSEPPKTDSTTPPANNPPPTEPGRTALPTDSDATPTTDGAAADSAAPPTGADTPMDATPADQKPAAARKQKPKATSKDALSKRKEPAPTAPAATGRYKTMLTVVEGELADMLRRPFEDQDFAALAKKYEPIAVQTEESIPSQIAKIRIRQLNDRATLRLARSELDKDNKEISDLRANMDKERMKIMTRRYEKAAERYELEGELRESFAFAPENRRFRLVDPTTKVTTAYVDIPTTVEGNPRHLIGQIVGIKVETKSFSPSARVPIAIAREVVDLSPRKLPDGGVKIPTAEPPPENAPPPEENASKDAAAANPSPSPEPAAHAGDKADPGN